MEVGVDAIAAMEPQLFFKPKTVSKSFTLFKTTTTQKFVYRNAYFSYVAGVFLAGERVLLILLELHSNRNNVPFY
jgi:hypothetical protein